jgi:hypothetical protein
MLALLVSGLACSLTGWQVVRGSGDVTEEERSVSGFTGVDLSGVGHVTISLGDEERLIVEAEENLLPYIETEVRGGMLVIGTRDGVNLRPTRSIEFDLTVTELDAIEVSGSGEIDGPVLEADRFTVDISGSGEVDLEGLEADTLVVEISGSGGLAIDGGTVREQRITISGSGDYRARELESDLADVKVSGSGSMTIRVAERLEADISGSGTVRYLGRPAVEQSVSGSGTIERIAD